MKKFLITPKITGTFLESLAKTLESHRVNLAMFRSTKLDFIYDFLRICESYKRNFNRDFCSIFNVFDSTLLDSKHFYSKLSKFEGFHIKSRDIKILTKLVHRIHSDNKIIGFSAHNVRELEDAFNKGVDYAFLSPIFYTPNKSEPLGVEVFATLQKDIKAKTFALGGVNKENLEVLKYQGLAGFAAIRYFL